MCIEINSKQKNEKAILFLIFLDNYIQNKLEFIFQYYK